MFFLFGKLALSAFFVGCSIAVALRREQLRSFAARLPGLALLCVTYLIVRVVGLWVIHKGLGVTLPSDVPGYFEHALRILGGEVPNREFSTPYGFLMNYLMAAAAFIYRDPFSILVMFQIGECLGLYLLLRAVVRQTGDARDGALLLLVYATNPLIAINLWLGGEDESLLVLALGAAAVLSTSRRTLAVMGLPAILFSTSKLLSAWILAPLALARGWWERLGMAVGLAALLGLIKLSGAALLSFDFARPEGTSDQLASVQTSGNLWYLITEVLHVQVPGYLPTALALVTLAGAGGWLWLEARRIPPLSLVLIGTAVLGLCFQVTYRMTAPPYLAPAAAAMAAILVMQNASTGVLALWLGLWSFENTVWFRLRDQLADSPVLRTVFDLYELALILTTVVALGWSISRGWRTLSDGQAQAAAL